MGRNGRISFRCEQKLVDGARKAVVAENKKKGRLYKYTLADLIIDALKVFLRGK